jgi:hypothetical protein
MADGVLVKPDRCIWCEERPVSDGLLWGCDACTYVCACCAEPTPFENGNDVDGVCDDCAAEYCEGWTTCGGCDAMNVLIVGGVAPEFCDACEGAREDV